MAYIYKAEEIFKKVVQMIMGLSVYVKGLIIR